MKRDTIGNYSTDKKVLHCFIVLFMFPNCNYQWCLCSLYCINFPVPII